MKSSACRAERSAGLSSVVQRSSRSCSAATALPLRAAATDYTDIWYLPSESGWGVNLIQAEDVIFATFFIYGPNNQPTWYVAIIYRDANGNFAGNLYSTVGPYFGGPWNPASRSRRSPAWSSDTHSTSTRSPFSSGGGSWVIAGVDSAG